MKTPIETRCRKVLLVEDDEQIRSTVKEALEMEDFEVSLAANGQFALDAINSGMAPAVILLDHFMPVMDGHEFLKRRVKDPRLSLIPVIYFTALPRSRYPELDPDIRVLSKPVDLTTLIAAVSEVLSA